MTTWPGRELLSCCCQIVADIGKLCGSTDAETFARECAPLGSSIGQHAAHALGPFRVFVDAFDADRRRTAAADHVPFRLDYGAAANLDAAATRDPAAMARFAEQIFEELAAIPTEWQVKGQLDKEVRVANSNTINSVAFDHRSTVGREMEHMIVHAVHHLFSIGVIARLHAAAGHAVPPAVLDAKYPTALQHRFYGKA